MLSIVVGTYNRIAQLKECIDSILNQTKCKYLIYVTDAGSTDGTIPYLESIASDRIVPIFVGKKLGQAKAYNDVFAKIKTPYVCWLSDDNIVVNNGLDVAVKILSREYSIGMVGLKTRDVEGPFKYAPYIGGISNIGILNVNQGVLPISLLRKLGGFSEEFRDYGIDPDLTAKVLFAGYKVVYTKKVSILHRRGWSTDKNSEEYKELKKKQEKSLQLYFQKYGCFDMPLAFPKKILLSLFKKVIYSPKVIDALKTNELVRDWNNVLSCKYTRLLDTIMTLHKDYYLVQSFNRSNEKEGANRS